MRQIKFRGYDEENQIWVYGSLFKNEICSRIIPFDSVIIENVLDEFYTVNDKSVGQFTGMQDKNGFPIYEGDLIRLFNNNNGYPEVVFKNQYVGGWLLSYEGVETSLGSRKQEDIEVIGNIHENPELLK